MKFSAALSLSLAPVALAKAVRNEYPVQRRGSHHKGNSELALQQIQGIAGFGITQTTIQDIIIIWANPGQGAETTTVNEQVTVTETVTAGAGQASVPPAAAATHSVIVGGVGGLTFQPDQVEAAIGDMVIFTFMSQNHTVTQSTFAIPCEAMEGGMNSGFQPNPNDTMVPPPQVAMEVMVDTPLWFYCAQMGHCAKGMTFSINPTADKTQAMFQGMAIAQNGQGGDSALAGGAGGGAASAAPPAETSSAAAGDQILATASSAAAPPPVETGAAGGAGGVVPGQGVMEGGACVCAVQCSTGSFPAVMAQGVGAFGGMAGGLPASMVEA